MVNSTLSKCLSTYSPISLDEMESVKLMNRVDTKYVCHERQLPAILAAAKEDYRVQEVAGKRIATYDTVYYDTEELEMYMRHHDQQLTRRKVRIRTYLDTGAEYLEVKKKNNRGRTKKKRIEIVGDLGCADSSPSATDLPKGRLTPCPMHGITVATGLCPAPVNAQLEKIEQFVSKHTPYEWEKLRATERTAFERITLVNKEKTERLTMDFHLRFEAMVGQQSADLGPIVIIELKRDGLMPSKMQHILRDMRIFPMKISKYCIGVAMTIPQVKHNRFKEKLVKLNKLKANS